MQMCPDCERVYDESDTPDCPYCHPIYDRIKFVRSDDDEDDAEEED